MLWSVDSCQNRVSADQYHLTVSWAQVSTHRGRVFFEVIPSQVTSFQMIAGSSCFLKIYMKYVVFMSLWPSTIKIWFQTYLGHENSASYLKIQAGKTFSYHGHVLFTLHVQFLCSNMSKFDRWVHAENLCSILKLVYFDSWSWHSFVSTCDVFLMSFSTGCTKWNTAAIKSLLLFMAGLFIGFLVEECVACQSRKSDFGWHRFLFSPCLIRKRSLKVSIDSGLTW